MDPLDVLAIVTGIALVTLAAVDLFMTVMHYDGYGPASRRLYRAWWWTVRQVAERIGPARAARSLAIAGTSMLLATILMWIALAWIGFALIYLPSIERGFTHATSGGSPWMDAVYFSGVALSTVGFGDVVPITPGLRIIAAVESLAGFAILTVTISYLLGVYGVLRDQSLLAAMIDDQTEGSGDPLGLAVGLLDRDDPATKLDDLHRGILSHGEGLQLYPVVHYLRRTVHRRSAIFILRMVGEASAHLRWGLPPKHPVAGDPAVAGLIRAQSRLMDDMAVHFESRDHAQDARSSEHVASRERFDRVRTALATRDEGFDTADEERFVAWATFLAGLDRVVAHAAKELAMDADEIGLTRGADEADGPRPNAPGGDRRR